MTLKNTKTIYISEEIHRRIKQEAAAKQLYLREYVEEALKKKLNEVEQPDE